MSNGDLPKPHGSAALEEPETYCYACGNEGEIEQPYGGPHGDKFSRRVPCPDCRQDDHDEVTEDERADERTDDNDTTGSRDPAL